MSRDRHVTHQPPDWSRKAHQLRPLTERERHQLADVRAARKRVQQIEDRKALWFFLGLAWGVGTLVCGYFGALALGAHLP